jgi:hypothetical protein
VEEKVLEEKLFSRSSLREDSNSSEYLLLVAAVVSGYLLPPAFYTSSYVSIRQNASAYVSSGCGVWVFAAACGVQRIRQHTPAYDARNVYTSANVCIRQLAAACGVENALIYSSMSSIQDIYACIYLQRYAYICSMRENI